MPDDTTNTGEAEGERWLREIRERERAAMGGPWKAVCIEESCGPFFRIINGERVFTPGWDVQGPVSVGNSEMGALIEADAAFMAEARADVPWLLDQLDAALRERDAARAALRIAANGLDEAASDIEHWGSYAGDYFRDKHNLADNVKRVKDEAEAARAALALEQP